MNFFKAHWKGIISIAVIVILSAVFAVIMIMFKRDADLSKKIKEHENEIYKATESNDKYLRNNKPYKLR